jgi:putative transposase
MLASRRSWWRIAARIQDQTARPIVPTRRGSATVPREAPVLIATDPNQVWSWDITDLRTPWRGCAFKAYSIIDIFSRKLVRHRVEEREVDDLAVEMFEEAFAEHGKPIAVHADSGAAMRSNAMKDLLHDAGVARTHNRPRVSNDNPFSESEFRTMKYRPNYPGTFSTLEDARAHVAEYSAWYNANHKHSGIALFSPDEVHDGSWPDRWQQRDTAQQAYYDQHPERFRRRPTTPAPAGLVGINHKPKPAEPATENIAA